MQVTLLSFGYKYGLPPDAGLALDVRGLPNPFYEPELKQLCGLDEPVRRFVLEKPQTQAYLAAARPLLLQTLQLGEARGCTAYTAAVGCTGGRHRSVAIAEALRQAVEAAGYPCRCEHRCVNRGL